MIDEQQILKMAGLAKLQVPEDEKGQLQQELNGILSMIETISQTDTIDIKPMHHPLDQTQPLRDDRAQGNSDPVDAIQSLSQSVEDHLYIVPKVID